MTNKTVYPEWVQVYRTRGKTVKKVGNTYYLYQRTSKRVPGKKYPQPVDTYIGVITPEGVIESGKKKRTLTGIEVKEYGFSRTLWLLCPESWKRPLGDRWEEVLLAILKKWSPESYLLREREPRSEKELHCQTAAQMASISRRLYKERGIQMEELEQLKNIYLLYLEKETVISKISEGQKALLEKLGVDIGLC